MTQYIYVMKRLFFVLVMLLPVFFLQCAAGGENRIEYITPENVSIEDVFFTRFAEQIYNADSTMKARSSGAGISKNLRFGANRKRML